MGRYIEGHDRRQSFVLPECVDDYVTEENPVRVVEAFIDELDLAERGFARAVPANPRRHCSSSTSMAISTASRPAAGWSARSGATSNSCG